MAILGTQEVPARYMPFTRSLMMCPPAQIGAASYDFQTHKGWKIHGKNMGKNMFFLMPWPCPSIICRSQTGYPSIPKSVGILRVKISGHNRLNYPIFGVYHPPRLHLHSCYIPICFLAFFGVISLCILYNIAIHRLYIPVFRNGYLTFAQWPSLAVLRLLR